MFEMPLVLSEIARSCASPARATPRLNRGCEPMLERQGNIVERYQHDARGVQGGAALYARSNRLEQEGRRDLRRLAGPQRT
jgi:hypothetical protein